MCDSKKNVVINLDAIYKGLKAVVGILAMSILGLFLVTLLGMFCILIFTMPLV